MAIKIETQKAILPVQFGELELEFDLSDKAVATYRDKVPEMQAEMYRLEAKIKAANDDEVEKMLGVIKETLKMGYEFMLGKGCFEAIYEQTPSSIHLLNYFIQLSEGISKEIKDLGPKEKEDELAEKYLENKKGPNFNKSKHNKNKNKNKSNKLK
ncbi:hypothetical protein [Carnobacterium divergens]|uniref:hypothetical protein n=1 Tax=Carnobacterium divergens TaxID=2748 RepID=UPI0039AEFD16